jgi:hypothetical protein
MLIVTMKLLRDVQCHASNGARLAIDGKAVHVLKHKRGRLCITEAYVCIAARLAGPLLRKHPQAHHFAVLLEHGGEQRL